MRQPRPRVHDTREHNRRHGCFSSFRQPRPSRIFHSAAEKFTSPSGRFTRGSIPPPSSSSSHIARVWPNNLISANPSMIDHRRLSTAFACTARLGWIKRPWSRGISIVRQGSRMKEHLKCVSVCFNRYSLFFFNYRTICCSWCHFVRSFLKFRLFRGVQERKNTRSVSIDMFFQLSLKNLLDDLLNYTFQSVISSTILWKFSCLGNLIEIFYVRKEFSLEFFFPRNLRENVRN